MRPDNERETSIDDFQLRAADDDNDVMETMNLPASKRKRKRHPPKPSRRRRRKIAFQLKLDPEFSFFATFKLVPKSTHNVVMLIAEELEINVHLLTSVSTVDRARRKPLSEEC